MNKLCQRKMVYKCVRRRGFGLTTHEPRALQHLSRVHEALVQQSWPAAVLPVAQHDSQVNGAMKQVASFAQLPGVDGTAGVDGTGTDGGGPVPPLAPAAAATQFFAHSPVSPLSVETALA